MTRSTDADASPAASPAAATGTGDGPRLRLGLVGYGMAGRLIHRPHLEAAGLSIAAVVTANPERVEAAGADLPGATVVPDLTALLDLDVDAVVLASPSGVHRDQALACIAAGVPTIVDKPLAVDAAQAAAVVTAAEQAGVPLTVFQNRRWDDDQRALRTLLDQEALGQVFRIERRYERYRPVAKNRWRERLPASGGGGLLLDLAVHVIDQAVQVFGRVTRVYAELAAHTTVAEDDAFLALEHEGGGRSHLGVLSVAAAPGPYLRALGTSGGYLVGNLPEDLRAFTAPPNEPGHTGWLIRGEQATPVPTPPGSQTDFYRAARAWLTGHGPAPVDPWDAVHVLTVVDAARRSAASGATVAV